MLLSHGRQVILDLMRQFPNAPSMTLAKRAYRENPELWPNLESCRTAVRRYFGVQGKRSRRITSITAHYRKPRKAGDWSDAIPEPLVQLPGWCAFEVAGPLRALVLSDLHIPFHDKAATSLALDYGVKKKANLILLNGDGMDHYGVSDWEKDPRQRDFPKEVKDGKFFLRGLRKRFARARIIYKIGNHEERYDRHMRLKSPDLIGIPDFEWQSVFGLDEQRIQIVRDKRRIRLGKLNVIHGHEYSFAISNPVNPARGFYLRAGGCHVLGSHFHQTSQHSKGNLEQKVIAAWSIGCLCDLHPCYRPINDWNHGFAFVEINKAGDFHVENLRIVDGKVW